MRVLSGVVRVVLAGVGVAGLAGCAASVPTLPAGADRAGLTTSASGTATEGPRVGVAAAGVRGASGTPRPTPSAATRTPHQPAGSPLLVEQMADIRGARQAITVTTSPGRAGPVLEAFELVAGSGAVPSGRSRP